MSDDLKHIAIAIVLTLIAGLAGCIRFPGVDQHEPRYYHQSPETHVWTNQVERN